MTSEPLLQESLEKLEASLAMLFASADSHIPFDPAKAYSPKEREPYDALSDRFLRSFESALKFLLGSGYGNRVPRRPSVTCSCGWRNWDLSATTTGGFSSETCAAA